MITKLKKVYYCEFCGKHGLSASHISRHEKSCTANINRYCNMCGCDDIKPVIKKYENLFIHKVKFEEKKRYKNDCINIYQDEPHWYRWEDIIIWNNDLDINDLDSDCAHCPNCMLTVIRANEINQLFSLYMCEDNQEINKRWCFNYKEKLANWWEAKNIE